LEKQKNDKSENDIIGAMHDVGSNGKFSSIVSSCQCYDGNEGCKEAAAEQSAAKHQKTSGDQKN
jgi:hypothetical protein